MNELSDKTKLLLNLIMEKKSANEIANILGISNRQLFNYLTVLKNKGFFFERKFYSNGVLTYKPVGGLGYFNHYYNNKYLPIFTDNKETSFRVLVTSDLHFGNSLERLDLVNRLYEYAVNNGIHNIFCSGDFLDGTYTKGVQLMDSYEQINHFIKDYPFDKNINTFGVMGDHDHSILYKDNINMSEVINNYRNDIYLVAANNLLLNLKNDKVSLHHHMSNGTYFTEESCIHFFGHLHKYCVYNNTDNTFSVLVPTLSDINTDFPTALDVVFNFDKGTISEVNIKQVYFGYKDIVVSESTYNMPNNTSENGFIRYETNLPIENFDIINTQEEEKTLTLKNEHGTDMIDRFNKRFGL